MGESARWADLTIHLVVKAITISAGIYFLSNHSWNRIYLGGGGYGHIKAAQWL